MQTHFTLAQLADPDTRDADSILRACVHCGFCTATCPTYVLLGDELDSPRGRIYLIKEMLERGRPATETVVTHIDRCLSCLACMTTCPSGVNYMHLVDHGRRHIARTYRRPLLDRWIRRVLAVVLPRPDLFRWALMGARVAQPIRALLPARLRAMLQLAPRSLGRSALVGPQVFPAEGTRRMRVALLAGCVQQVIDAAINQATLRLLRRHGVEVVVVRGVGCCGALAHHLGDDVLDRVRANVDAWTAELDRGLDAVVINASGCGTMVKDYGFLLRGDPAYAAKAARVSTLARDVSEVMEQIGLSGALAAGPR
ncbi:MAG: glycolate oxidase subunit GlcF, partial [Stellaceae bacterium]